MSGAKSSTTAVVSQQGKPSQGLVPASAAEFTFDQMRRLAESFAKSNLFGVKDADQALSLMMIAHAEGKHPAKAAMDYHIIKNRPSKTAEAMLRDFQASGGIVEWNEYTDTKVSGTFTHPLSPKPLTVEWDIERAKKAGLAGDNWKGYSRAMLRSRVVSEGVRATAPQATSGLHTVEEVREFADDPDMVVETVEKAASAAAATSAEADEAPPREEIDAFIASMDVKTRDELVTAYNAANRSTEHLPTKKIYRETKDMMLAAIEGGEI